MVIWLALVYWTYADARRRIADPLLVGCATAASLFPFVGTIVYMIVRPPEYLDDVRERELEIQAAEARLAELGYQLCPHCDYEVEKDFLRCPNCMRKLKDPCTAAASRSTRCGRSARSARPRSARSPRRRAAPVGAATAPPSSRWPAPRCAPRRGRPGADPGAGRARRPLGGLTASSLRHRPRGSRSTDAP